MNCTHGYSSDQYTLQVAQHNFLTANIWRNLGQEFYNSSNYHSSCSSEIYNFSSDLLYFNECFLQFAPMFQ